MRIGIDFGGTKIEAIAIGDNGEELDRNRRPTPRDDYAGTIGTIAAMVTELEERFGQKGSVGVGIPGAISPATGLVKNANSTWCIGKPFNADLGAALGREVKVENDANCLAVSEATDGAGAGEDVVFAVILGTGVGGGIAIHGKPLTGRHAIAGEWGHNPLPWPRDDERPGPKCYCGQLGCVETWCAGPGFAADHERVTGTKLAPVDIIAAARSGDAKANASLDRYIDRLARSLATAINMLDPDVIVLGGGMSNVKALYKRLPESLQNYVFSDVCNTPIRPALHGDSSGVRGAAFL